MLRLWTNDEIRTAANDDEHLDDYFQLIEDATDDAMRNLCRRHGVEDMHDDLLYALYDHRDPYQGEYDAVISDALNKQGDAYEALVDYITQENWQEAQGWFFRHGRRY